MDNWNTIAECIQRLDARGRPHLIVPIAPEIVLRMRGWVKVNPNWTASRKRKHVHYWKEFRKALGV
jgi:hypothetical protein